MKKVWALGLILLMMTSLFACTKKKQERDVTGNLRDASSFSARISVDYNDKQYEYTFVKNSTQIEVLVLSPDSLKGFSVKLTEQKYTIAYHGIAFVTEKLPDTLTKVIGPAFDLLDVIEKRIGSQQAGDDQDTLTYEVAGEQVICYFDSQSGTPQKILIGEHTQIEFLSFSFG